MVRALPIIDTVEAYTFVERSHIDRKFGNKLLGEIIDSVDSKTFLQNALAVTEMNRSSTT
jgi:hypothetical protein